MSLNLDPEKNKEQFEKVRSFSAKYMLVARKGFWLFMGGVFVIASPFIYFSEPSSFNGTMSQTESALFALVLGIFILAVTFSFSWFWRKMSTYEPQPNKGDEWLK